ncbi:hypothetical protein K469DRAFT_693539 [Zopfia rhizophila CBS 207.26]|uniref:Uncharacterized protein n=1 Tax=Zopfia rhizophila CBS 207.26 TaxID=1314779 RepID=A0A6A6DKN2_9PEZI|nr:hypothetical protein K469DRAFT_693539 [Zopfia rhizophila CBS 207.26]
MTAVLLRKSQMETRSSLQHGCTYPNSLIRNEARHSGLNLGERTSPLVVRVFHIMGNIGSDFASFNMAFKEKCRAADESRALRSIAYEILESRASMHPRCHVSVPEIEDESMKGDPTYGFSKTISDIIELMVCIYNPSVFVRNLASRNQLKHREF